MKMKKSTSFIAVICLTLMFIFAIPTESQARWHDIADGLSYIDRNGCIHHVHTQEFRILGITVATRTVDDLVGC